MPPFQPRRFFGVNHQLSRLKLLLTAAVILCGFVTANSQEQMSREVRIFVHNLECQAGFDEAKKKAQDAAQNYEGWQVKFGEQTVTMDRSGQATVKLTYLKERAASYNVSVIVPNESKAKLNIIFYNDWSKDRDGTGDNVREVIGDHRNPANDVRDYEDSNRDGVVQARPYAWWDSYSETQPVRQPYMVLGVHDAQCQREAKRIWVFLQSYECDKEHYKSYSINIDNEVVKPDVKDASTKVKLEPGEHKISISAPDYLNAKIKSAEVLRPSKETDSKYYADDSGSIKVMLKESLWDGTSTSDLPLSSTQPYIFLYTKDDCDPSYGPPLQRIGGDPQIKIVTFKGKVFLSDEGSDVERQPVRGSMIESGQLIRTQPGATVELVTSDKRLIIVEEATVVQIKVAKVEGKWEINTRQRAGRINVKHLRFNTGEDGVIWQVITPTASVTDKDTIYSVTYDETSKSTAVAVEEGQLTVTPTDPLLKPVNLDAHQMVEVFEDRVSSVSPYLRTADPKGSSLTKESGGLFNRPLLLVGIGAAALVGLLIVVAGITFRYRKVNRAPVQAALQQSGIKVEAAPANRETPQRVGTPASSAVATNEWRCPNPQCGKLVPAGKRFCTDCGTQSGFKAEARAVNIASPALAWRCPNPQCGKLVPAGKKFCTACGTPVIGRPPNPGPIVT